MKKNYGTGSILIVVGGVALLAGFWLLISPELRKVSEGFATIELFDKKALSSSGSQQLIAQRQVKQSLDIANRKKEVDALLPDKENPVDLSIQIEALARSMGITLTGLTVTDGTTGTGTTSSQAASATATIAGTKVSAVNVSVSGNYDLVKAFVKAMPTVNRAITIQDVTLTSVSQAGNTQVIGSISAIAYTYAKK